MTSSTESAPSPTPAGSVQANATVPINARVTTRLQKLAKKTSKLAAKTAKQAAAISLEMKKKEAHVERLRGQIKVMGEQLAAKKTDVLRQEAILRDLHAGTATATAKAFEAAHAAQAAREAQEAQEAQEAEEAQAIEAAQEAQAAQVETAAAPSHVSQSEFVATNSPKQEAEDDDHSIAA